MSDPGFLILTRKVGEGVTIKVGRQTIKVRVSSVTSGRQVRLSFSAPRAFPIIRDELLTPDD